MNLTQAVRSCFANFATFQGRAARSEYWYWALFLILAIIALFLLSAVIFVSEVTEAIFGILYLIFVLGIILPTLAVSVRRFHDMNRSGWWYLVNFVPSIGNIIVLIWFMFRGTSGSNRFGPDPLGGWAEPDETTYTHKSSIPKVSRDD